MDARFGAWLRASALVASLACCGRIFAGSPPLITDDPETPGYHGWEINITESFEHVSGEAATESPLFDINYGLTSDRDQLKVEFAVVSLDPEDADAEWGISDLLVGYKYRFIDADDTCTGWAVSFYPQVSSPTADEDRGLGSGQTELFFPFEFQKSICDDHAWINPEFGYDVVLGDDDFNFWKFGLAMGYEYESGLELQGEVGAFVFPQDAEPDDPFFNFGFAYPLNKNVVVLGSAGRSFRPSTDGTPDFFCQLGFQFLFGAAADEENPAHEEGAGGGDQPEDPAKAESLSPSFIHDHTATSTHHVKQYLVNPAS
jgi:hypothetical protein